MSDLNRAASAGSGAASDGPAEPHSVLRGAERPHELGGASALANGGVSPASRSLDIRNLLNDDNDEFVGGSDHDGAQDGTLHNGSIGDVAVSSSRDSIALDDRAGCDVEPNAEAMQVAFPSSATGSRDAISSVSCESVTTSEGHSDGHREGRDHDLTVDPVETPRLPENRVLSGSTEIGEVVDKVTSSGRPTRVVRAPLRFKTENLGETKPKSAKAKPKKPNVVDIESEIDVVLVPGASADLSPRSSTLPSRMRDKRRASAPSPGRETPPKKSKMATRPKRAAAAAVHNYVDVTASDHDEPDTHAEMVIANFEERNRPSASASAKTKKRKSISQRQLEELMTEERDAGSSSPVFQKGFSGSSDAPSAPGLILRPCEFCRQCHSAHAVFKCHSCLRVYHEKCLVDAFRPNVQLDTPIEEQMEKLYLYRPPGHSAVLRCTSCQAALIDFYNNRGFHWNCSCPTCTKLPEKIADYRRVSLKRIIDEHNLEFAMKKEKKGGGAKKQPFGDVSKTAMKAKSSQEEAVQDEPHTKVVTATSNAQSRLARSTRRSRGDAFAEDDPAGSGDIKPIGETEDQQKSSASLGKGRNRGLKATRRNTDGSLQNGGCQDMEVDQEYLTREVPVQDRSRASRKGDLVRDDAGMDVLNPDESSEVVTFDNLDDLIAITKEDNDTWSFRIACSSSKETHESGTYKEATLFWHPGRDKTLKCACCNKIDQSLKWFVHHTDAKLLSGGKSEQGVIDIYSYVFVIQKNGQLVPLKEVISLLRQRYGQSSNDRERRDSTVGKSRGRGGRKRIEVVDARQQALDLLRDVKYSLKNHGQDVNKRRRSSVSSLFSCDVICAERGRWLRPIGGNDLKLRNMIADCSVSADVYKTGTLDVCDGAKNFKSCRIHCKCCDEVFNGSAFIQHTRLPLLVELQRDTKQHDGEHEPSDVEDEEVRDDTPEIPLSNEAEMAPGKKIRSYSCVIGVVMRDTLTSIRLDAFQSALEKLGSQAEINKAISAITKTQDTTVSPSH